MTNFSNIEKVRTTGRRTVIVVTFIYAVVAVCAGSVAGNALVIIAPTAAFLCTLSILSRPLFGKLVDYALVAAMVGQTVLITAAFAGHPWQMDSHMIYFATLAMTILLVNPWPLLAAAGLIAVHHAGLSIALPSLVYPTTGVTEALTRTVFHAAIVVMETAVLFWSVNKRLIMLKDASTNHAELMTATRQAEAALGEAGDARATAQAAQEHAENEAARAAAALEELQAQMQQTAKADMETKRTEERLLAEQDATHKALEHVIGDLSDALAGLAAKNLGGHLETPFPEAYDVLRKDYNSTIGSLTEAITSVATQVEAIKGNAVAIATTAKEQSQRSEVRSNALSELTASVKDLEQAVVLVAQSAAEATETVSISRSHADEGVRIVELAVEAMQEIDASGTEIRKIISLIEGISFQTNLLSLNAGVEAARAGEAGLGFAVVATEVRALAQRSAESANEIKSLIAESDKHVENGVSLVKQSGNALEQIQDVVSRTNSQVDGINTSVQSQNQRLAKIATALEQITGSVRDDATQSGEAAHVSAALNNATDTLSQTVSVFTLDGSLNAKASGAPHSHAA